MARAQSRYLVVAPFHHPDGVELPGDQITLSAEMAARGVESGALLAIPEPPTQSASSEE